MKQIEIHSYVTEKNPRNPTPCYIYKPDQPAFDQVLEEIGWKRKDLIGEGHYFYWTESDLRADNTSKRLGLNIDTPEVGLIWKIDHELKKDVSDTYYQP